MTPHPATALKTLLTLAAGLLLACDDPVGTDSGPTFIRFVNAARDADGPLRFTLAGGASALLQQGESSAYAAADAREYAVTITDDNDHWMITDDLEVARGTYQTLIAFGEASSAGGVLIGDEPAPPVGNQAQLRLLHLATRQAAPLTVHIVGGDREIGEETIAVSNLTYPASLGYASIAEGLWRIVVTGANDAVLIDSGAQPYGAGQAFTLIIMSAQNGAVEIVRLRDGP